MYRSKEHTCNTLISENAKVKYLQTELDDKNEDLNRVNQELFKYISLFNLFSIIKITK